MEELHTEVRCSVSKSVGAAIPGGGQYLPGHELVNVVEMLLDPVGSQSTTIQLKGQGIIPFIYPKPTPVAPISEPITQKDMAPPVLRVAEPGQVPKSSRHVLPGRDPGEYPAVTREAPV